MKKRIIAAVAALALVMTTLSGCGGTQTEPETTSTPDAIGTVEENVTTDTENNESQEVNSDAAENEQSMSSNGETAATAKPTKAPSVAQKPTAVPAATQTPTAPTTAPTVHPSVPSATPTPVPTPTPTPAPQLSASEVMGKIMAALPNTYNLSEMPEEIYEGVYKINPADYDSVSIYGAMINVKSNEVIVIKAKDANGLEKAKSALNARKKALEEQWKRYLEDQYQIVLGGKVVTKGLYAALIIAEGAQSGANAFNSAF